MLLNPDVVSLANIHAGSDGVPDPVFTGTTRLILSGPDPARPAYGPQEPRR